MGKEVERKINHVSTHVNGGISNLDVGILIRSGQYIDLYRLWTYGQIYIMCELKLINLANQIFALFTCALTIFELSILKMCGIIMH